MTRATYDTYYNGATNSNGYEIVELQVNLIEYIFNWKTWAIFIYIFFVSFIFRLLCYLSTTLVPNNITQNGNTFHSLILPFLHSHKPGVFIKKKKAHCLKSQELLLNI